MRPIINAISPTLIKKILAEAKRVLATVGIEVRGRALRELLIERGVPVDQTGERLLFPEHLVEQALVNAPGQIILYDRDGQPAADLSGQNVHFIPGSSGLKILDHRTGATRLANTADFVEFARIGSQLEHIPYLATAFSTNDDIEPQVSDAWRMFLLLTQTKKPFVSGAFTEHGVPRMGEMMALFRDDRADLIRRPMAIFTITATGNFRYSEDSCQNLLDCAAWGIPMEIVPVTLMGLIAPVTVVGAAVFHTVDVLAGIVMAQITRPGTPVLFGGAPAAFHMKAATSPMAAIEALQLDIAYAAIGDHLNIPTQAYMALSDGKFLDAQAGAETFGSAILAALAGINSVSGPGMLDYVLTFSLPKLVYDNDLAGQALHLVREIVIEDDLPVTPLIDELLREQHLITAEHTLANWPKTLYLPHPVTDRLNRENWQKAGGRTLIERAAAEVERLLGNYHPIETDPAVVGELKRVIRAGLVDQQELPAVPAVNRPAAVRPSAGKRRPPRGRRRRG